MESLKLTKKEFGGCAKDYDPRDCFTEEELENLNDDCGMFVCPLGGCIKDIERKKLDEETAFDPSEFFENEGVAATFDEVVEANSNS